MLFKALGLIGLGQNRVRRVPTDDQARMRADRLPGDVPQVWQSALRLGFGTKRLLPARTRHSQPMIEPKWLRPG